MLKKNKVHIKRHVVLMEHKGAIASLMRTIVAGFNAVMGDENMVFAKNDEELVNALAPQLRSLEGATIDAPMLRQLINGIRAEHESRRVLLASKLRPTG
jgi:hypothetical protein